MIIAIPTGVKIFSWLDYSFSKNYLKLVDKCIDLIDESKSSIYGDISVYNLYPRSNRYYLQPNNQEKALVIYGDNLESNVGKKKYTSIVKHLVGIPNRHLGILVGLLLSDGYINKTSGSKVLRREPIGKCRFGFKQSIIHHEYFFFTFMQLSHYCIAYPKLVKSRINNKTYYGLQFMTRTLPCFSVIRLWFYKDNVKIMPHNLYDIITYESLAHIIMSDGARKNRGLNLHLQNFSCKELIFFMDILKIKFDLDCTLHKSRNLYTFYIRSESTKKLYPHIKDLITPSMRYKLLDHFVNLS